MDLLKAETCKALLLIIKLLFVFFLLFIFYLNLGVPQAAVPALPIFPTTYISIKLRICSAVVAKDIPCWH